jgi:HEAT repeat protein
MVGLSQRLTSLVKAAPPLVPYVLLNLGKNVYPPPGQDHGFIARVEQLRKQITLTFFKSVTSLSFIQGERHLLEIERRRMEDALLEVGEKVLTMKLFQSSSLNLFLKKVSDAKPELLKTHVSNKDPLVRLLVISTISRRRVHLEKELIERLDDSVSIVREAAHRALIRLGRGTDFGPTRGASHKGIARSIEKWNHWHALQLSESPEMLAKRAALAAAGKRAPSDIIPLALVSIEQPELTTEVARMSEELVSAKGDEQLALLARLRESKGIDNTDALALAIPKLSGEAQRHARDALAERLTRMTAATLRDKLQDDNVEVRRAAAAACGHKKAKEHIPDLLPLLDDAEIDVVQSARMALVELTGQDFGPSRDAGSSKRADAAAAWRKWWKERQDKLK